MRRTGTRLSLDVSSSNLPNERGGGRGQEVPHPEGWKQQGGAWKPEPELFGLQAWNTRETRVDVSFLSFWKINSKTIKEAGTSRLPASKKTLFL